MYSLDGRAKKIGKCGLQFDMHPHCIYDFSTFQEYIMLKIIVELNKDFFIACIRLLDISILLVVRI